MSRPRKRTRQDLPPNLYQERDGRYRYRHPITGKKHPMGADRARAVAAARKLNDHLQPAPADLVNQVLGGDRLVETVVDRYQAEYLDPQGLAAGTLKNTLGDLRHFRDAFGPRRLDDLSVHDLAGFLNQRRNASYIRHRNTVIGLYSWALSQGLAETNPAANTLRKKLETRARRRLTVEQFRAIYQDAPEWLRLAMDLSLLTLQARNEICAMRFDDVKEQPDGSRRLYVVRKKTAKKTDTAYISIAVGEELDELLRRARGTGILSPMVVHYRQPRSGRKAEKPHWTAVMPDRMTTVFQETRDRCAMFKGMPKAERPSFHEIRALGAHLYEKAGQPVEYVQALLGHSGPGMTRHYQDGHEQRWNDAAAELDLAAVLGR